MVQDYIMMKRADLEELFEKAVQKAVDSIIATPFIGDNYREEMWSRAKAAAVLGVSPQTLSKMVLRNEIHAVKPGGKFKFLKSRIMEYLANKNNDNLNNI